MPLYNVYNPNFRQEISEKDRKKGNTVKPSHLQLLWGAVDMKTKLRKMWNVQWSDSGLQTWYQWNVTMN
jgi:hypothetical protein